jgi:hypothetical protein
MAHHLTLGIGELALREQLSHTLCMNDAEVLSQALKLPLRKREQITEVLFASIKYPSKKHLEKLWAVESEARIDKFLSGKTKTVDGESVLNYRFKK